MNKVAGGKGEKKRKMPEVEEVPTRAPSDDEEDDVVGGTKKKTLSKEHLQRMMDGRRNKGSLTKRLNLCIPPRLMQRRLRTDKIVAAVPLGSAIYAAGAVERLIDDIMASARDIAATERKQVVSSRHIMAALKGDEELGRMFKNVTIAQGGIGHPKSSNRPAIIPPMMTSSKVATKSVGAKTAAATTKESMDDSADHHAEGESSDDDMGDGEEDEDEDAQDDSQEY